VGFWGGVFGEKIFITAIRYFIIGQKKMPVERKNARLGVQVALATIIIGGIVWYLWRSSRKDDKKPKKSKSRTKGVTAKAEESISEFNDDKIFGENKVILPVGKYSGFQ
jgi:hypothetical protein